MRRARRATVAAVLLVAMAGCSAADDPAPSPTTASESPASPSSTPTPTPTPTQDAGPRDLSDPELGIEFTALPDVTGDAALAVESYQQYEIEYWRALRTNSLSPALDIVASPEVKEFVNVQVENNEPQGVTADGTFAVAVTAVTADGDLLVIEACQDFTDILLRTTTETYTAADAGVTAPVATRLVMSDPGGVWRVESREEVGTC